MTYRDDLYERLRYEAECERRNERVARCPSCDTRPVCDDPACKGLCDVCFETTEVA